jgi:hypothetical protein
MKNITVAMATVLALASLASTAAAECRPRTTASAAARRGPAGIDQALGMQTSVRALESWKQRVRERYGSRFANWNAARDRRSNCTTTAEFIKCSASATPCEPTVRAPSR